MLAFVVACGEPEAEMPPAELAEICGVEGPVRVLSAAANEEIGQKLLRDDVVLAVIREYDDDLVDGIPSLQTMIGSRLVSVDPCGRDARVIAPDVELIHEPRDDAAPWLARTDAEELYWIDPHGRFEPRRVGRAAWAAEHEGHTYVTVLGENAGLLDLARLTIDGDAFALETVAVGLRAAEAWLGVRPGTALVVDTEDRLLEVELVTGETSLVLEGVAEFAATQQGRFVLWRAVRDYTSTSLLQPWFVLDRDTGTQLQVSDDADVRFLGHAVVRTESGALPVTHVWLLPGFQAHLLEGTWSWFYALPDGRVLTSQQGLEALWIFDAPDAAPRRLFDGQFSQLRLMDDSVWASFQEPELEVVRVPLDGSPAHTLVTGVYNPLWLGGDAFAGVDVRDDDFPLVVVRDGVPGKVDEGVGIYLYVQNVDDLVSGTREFYYQVYLDAGRRGLYRVATAP